MIHRVEACETRADYRVNSDPAPGCVCYASSFLSWGNINNLDGTSDGDPPKSPPPLERSPASGIRVLCSICRGGLGPLEASIIGNKVPAKAGRHRGQLASPACCRFLLPPPPLPPPDSDGNPTTDPPPSLHSQALTLSTPSREPLQDKFAGTASRTGRCEKGHREFSIACPHAPCLNTIRPCQVVWNTTGREMECALFPLGMRRTEYRHHPPRSPSLHRKHNTKTNGFCIFFFFADVTILYHAQTLLFVCLGSLLHAIRATLLFTGDQILSYWR